ncbi:MAG: cardiolipin synthase [Candidatus Sericytochromatia bacterium]|nr:MAG: cardiolipin synthase [Candidatus Sericytochromatia bacterium]
MKKKILITSLLALFISACNSNLNLASLDENSLISTQSIQSNTNNLDYLEKLIDFSTGTKNTYNNYNVKFYIDGPEAFPAMKNAILSAKKSIYMETFIFKNDYTGREFSDALIQKAKEGVEVKFLYDHLGNTDIRLMNNMVRNGVHVEGYNKGVITSKGANITHRKILIIDGKVAFTGGMNIGNEYSTGKWHDTHVSYEGEAVKETLKEFLYDWKKAGGTITPRMYEALNIKFEKTENKTYPMRVTVTSPHEKGKEEDIKRMLFAVIDGAKDNIKISMPYFSDDELIERLIMAKKRGVKVLALIPAKSDSGKLIDQVSDITSNQLTKEGVEVYRGGVKNNTFNHSKVMTVDNVWTTIGSCNADRRAFHVNQELNVSISDPEFTQEFNRRYFDYHLTNSEKWEYKNFSWSKKLLHSLIEKLDYFI